MPKAVAAGWLKVLRRSNACVAFKASTQHSIGRQGTGKGLGSAEDATAEALSRSPAVGTEALMGLLKNYCRSQGIKTSISVGVVGYPNTGKSSLINSLRGKSVVGTSSSAGFTKSMAEVSLDKNITLLDSPGVVFDDKDDAATALRNCVNPDELDDPQGAVALLLKRTGPEQLMMLYALPRFDRGDAATFLSLVARRLGKVRKGGTPDKDAAAVAVLRDWNEGKIKYFAQPPKDDVHLVTGSAALVHSDGGLEYAAGDAAALATSDAGGLHAYVALDPSAADWDKSRGGMGDEDDDEDDDEEEGGEDQEEVGVMEDSEEEVLDLEVMVKKAPKKAAAAARPVEKAKFSGADLGSSDLARGSADARRSAKASKKKAAKDARRGKGGMHDDDDGDAYDFGAM